MIAERAGLSPGGVFTTFEDKVAILSQIVGEQRERLIDRIEEIAPTLQGNTRERILTIIGVAHEDEFPRLRMMVAYIGASYGWGRRLEEEHRQLHRRLVRVIGAILQEGVARGELRPDVDLELVLEVISSAYLRNYRTAYYAGFDAEALNARVRRQLDIIFDGAGAKAVPA